MGNLSTVFPMVRLPEGWDEIYYTHSTYYCHRCSSRTFNREWVLLDSRNTCRWAETYCKGQKINEHKEPAEECKDQSYNMGSSSIEIISGWAKKDSLKKIFPTAREATNYTRDSLSEIVPVFYTG